MTTKNMTLIARLATLLSADVALPAHLSVHPATEKHAAQLAELWFAAYPPEIATDFATAEKEIEDMFGGAYGQLWAEASPLLFSGRQLVAALCTVYKAPWDATPTCPFIVDCMVDARSRRMGLATFLLQEAARAVLRGGADHIALRVLVDNTGAINLYRKLGFFDWDEKLYSTAVANGKVWESGASPRGDERPSAREWQTARQNRRRRRDRSPRRSRR